MTQKRYLSPALAANHLRRVLRVRATFAGNQTICSDSLISHCKKQFLEHRPCSLIESPSFHSRVPTQEINLDQLGTLKTNQQHILCSRPRICQFTHFYPTLLCILFQDSNQVFLASQRKRGLIELASKTNQKSDPHLVRKQLLLFIVRYLFIL